MDEENNYETDSKTDCDSGSVNSIISKVSDESLLTDYEQEDNDSSEDVSSDQVEQKPDEDVLIIKVSKGEIENENDQVGQVYNSQDHERNKQTQLNKKLYIDDEVCRILEDGSIVFGVLAPIKPLGSELHVIWTVHNSVESESVTTKFSQEFLANGIPPVALIDRKLDCGNLVRLDSEGPFGEVVNVNWVAYVQVANTQTAIVDIPCSQLEPILPFEVGDRIELNGWIGEVNSVECSATILFTDGKSCKVTFSDLNPDKIPYPGRKVVYSTDELARLGTKYLDNGERIFKLYGNNPPAAYVVFMNIKSIDVEWKYHIPLSQAENYGDEKPNTTISRRLLKGKVRNIDRHRQQWDSEISELLDKFHYYTQQRTDTSLSISNMELKNHVISEFFLGENECDDSSSDADTPVPSGAPDIVKILRICRVIDVEWSSGMIDSFRSCDTVEKISFKEPFRQIVQRKSSLSACNEDYGITLARNKDDTVLVKWFNECQNREVVTTTESKYDIDYHSKYGKIKPGEIVVRSSKCTLPDEIFEFGCIDQITKQGKVIVTCYPSDTQESLAPFDIDVKVNDTVFPGMGKTKSEIEFLREQFIDTITEANAPIQANLFSSCLRNYNISTIPLAEKFEIIPHAPESHYYYSSIFEYTEEYIVKMEFDRKMLLLFFAEGIWVKAYKDRPDLYSAMMVGRKGTPYEDGLFNFDIQLTYAYPDVSPNFYMTTSLSNPAFPCPFPFSLLVPGSHHFSRLYSLNTLSLLEALLAVNKFIFEPTLNGDENNASFSKEQCNVDNKEFYCQVTIRILDYFFKLLARPPTNWRNDIVRYIQATIPSIISRLSSILLPNSDNSIDDENNEGRLDHTIYMDIPYPLTRGFITSLENRIQRFQELNETMAGHK